MNLKRFIMTLTSLSLLSCASPVQYNKYAVERQDNYHITIVEPTVGAERPSLPSCKPFVLPKTSLPPSIPDIPKGGYNEAFKALLLAHVVELHTWLEVREDTINKAYSSYRKECATLVN